MHVHACNRYLQDYDLYTYICEFIYVHTQSVTDGVHCQPVTTLTGSADCLHKPYITAR